MSDSDSDTSGDSGDDTGGDPPVCAARGSGSDTGGDTGSDSGSDAGGDSGTNTLASCFAITITANRGDYAVVIDDQGNEIASKPILGFQITGGPPNGLIDIQLSVDSAAGLTGGPGLSSPWDSSLPISQRYENGLFSSWSNGDNTLRLDGSGSATYKMPLEWWRDLARVTWVSDTKSFFYRVISVDDDTTTVTGQSSADGVGSASSVVLRNNLVSFKVVESGYTGRSKPVTMTLVVLVPNTTNMYSFVQFLQGAQKLWTGPGPCTYPPITQYGGIKHDANFEDLSIDSLDTDPRYAANYTVSPDGKQATADDNPDPGAMEPQLYTHYYSSLDFDTRVYLNFEVPAQVHISRQAGSPPQYGVVTGDMLPASPSIISSWHWSVRVLQAAQADGSVATTYPDSFSGP